MSINFTSKNVKLTGALKAFTEKQLAGIERISGQFIDAEVIVAEEKLNYTVEMSLKTRLHTYHIESKNPILKQALRSVLSSLKTQARKNKEKMKKERKRSGRQSLFSSQPVEIDELETGKPPDGTPKVAISNNISRSPLTVEEAIFFLKESGENALMFTHAETDRLAVIFFNKNAELSIIEANQ